MSCRRTIAVTAGIKVIEQIPTRIEETERRRLAGLARRILKADPMLRFRGPFGHNVATGSRPGPCIIIEDHGGIALAGHEEEADYAYRALLLAGAGDTLVIAAPRNSSFENYCRDVLGLGPVAVEVVEAQEGRHRGSLTHRAADDRSLVRRLAERAGQANGLTVLPYMGLGAAWRFAGNIARESGQKVWVAAPPPRLAARVNDKAWFAERVEEVLGPRAEPPSRAVHSVSSLVRHAAGFAKLYPSIAVKLPDSSSSAGNLVLDSAELAPLSPRRLASVLVKRLKGIGWRHSFPLVVTAWEKPVLVSPSVQLWIPDAADGAPIVEGVFDQLVSGRAAVFSGGAPSALPALWQERMASDAVKLGTLFQSLGYFGRCSFDAVLVGHDGAAPELHWVECNGRWGGISIPMTLANRLNGDWTSTPPMVLDQVVPQGRGWPLPAFLEALDDELYRADGPRRRGLIIMAPRRIERGHGFQVMVLDGSFETAQAHARRLESRLTEMFTDNSRTAPLAPRRFPSQLPQ